MTHFTPDTLAFLDELAAEFGKIKGFYLYLSKVV